MIKYKFCSWKKTTFFASLPNHIIIWKMQKFTNMGGDYSKFFFASLFNTKERKKLQPRGILEWNNNFVIYSKKKREKKKK